MTVTDSLAYSKEYSLICLIFHPNKLRMNRLLQNPVTLNMATFITQHTRNDEKISNFALILVKKTNTKHIMTPKEIRNQRLAEKMLKNLKRRNFEAIYCPTAAEAVERVSAMIPDGSTVSWGGSMTIRDMGLTEALHKRDLRLLDRDLAADRDEAQRIYREAFSADFYLTSANAISEDGVVVNIDGNGNRVAAITFGPKKVILVVALRHQDPVPGGRRMPQLQLAREHLQLHPLHAQLSPGRPTHSGAGGRGPGVLGSEKLRVKN